MNLKDKLSGLLKKEESLIYDLEKDFKSNIMRFGIKLFSELGSSIVIMVLFLALGAIHGIGVYAPLILIYLFQLGIVEIIKWIFQRKRPPSFQHSSLLGIKTSSGSFPSGHTSNVFTSALLISVLFSTPLVMTSILFIFAGLVAVSRLFLGKHYIVDVVGGAILGIILTIIGLQLYVLGYNLFTS